MVLRRGTPGNDRLVGTVNDDQLYGLGGRDTLRGQGGDDHLEGGAGDDALFGEGGNDQLHDGTGSDTLLGGAGDDQFEMTADPAYQDTARGGDGNDRFTGRGLGNDRLYGENGADWFDVPLHQGGRFEVTMTGGDGSDHYRILMAEENEAEITVADYVAGVDTLDLRTPNTFLAAIIHRFDRFEDGRLDSQDGDQVQDDGDSLRFVEDFPGDEAPDIELRIDGLTLNLLDTHTLF